ncbi:isocitrate lyase/phosphoenolpyruvate mutase family protein [Myxococcus sp. AM011]|uniref:isocitrate lyase/PEP mutase family protein n=1 Tax=Myxococcus sp. AM011 TaxID=2745200 RepID=UPI0015963B15|nr:isocitrate lyase/phosphoenolpyruvate mutase family protein [Myxococcus sp. AM011]NVJ27070.1 isocitrate lyase/phosphoenolpyruvate mutase family protein [Myxococcus sp. AM011]
MPVAPPNSARDFRQLHEAGLLLLVNAWDAGSARVMESLGAKALATTSAGVAWAQGYPDGDKLPVSRLLDTVTAIARLVKVPLTVDIEGGYSDDPNAVGEVAAGVVEAGGVGINLEDGGGSVDLLCAKIEAVKRAAAKKSGDLFVNARTDVFLRGIGPAERRVEETLARARRYRAAGADGLFVPGLKTPVDIKAVVTEAGLPLNLMAIPGLPPASELASLGVRRVSAGAGMAQAIFGRIAALTTDFLRDGGAAPAPEAGISYPTLNTLMAPR